MEFQEGLMKLMVHKPVEKQWVFPRDTETEKVTQKDSPRRRWKFFQRSSSSTLPSKSSQQSKTKRTPPEEFLCPITGSLMAEPVIVSSGHTFESACVKVCKSLNFIPSLTDDTSTPDFSSVIPNLALKSTILIWCKNSSIDPPKPLDSKSAEKLVRTFMASQAQKSNTTQNNYKEPGNNVVVISEKELLQRVKENPPANLNHASTEPTPRSNHFYSSSDESVGTRLSLPPLPLATRPSCCSSSSSSTEIEIQNPNSSEEEEEMLTKLKSPQVFEVEEALIWLRKITRTSEEARAQLCTQRLLSTLKSLIVSRYTGIQVNSLAALVNLSLQKSNKIKIVRSGIVPNLIDALKAGSPEAQEHASGAIFSLALDDDSKTAIGVLGALPPLLHLLRSDSERTRHDSALALYNLTLVLSNRARLVKDGSVPVLLGMVKSGHMPGRILLILCNLGSSLDGRVALLDAGAVDCLVNMLRRSELYSESTREGCVAALYSLSLGGLRFKGLAKAAGATEVLRKVERGGSERSREKARKILEVMKGREKEEEEEVDWEELLESGFGLGSQNRCRLGDGLDGSKANSSEF